MVYKNKKIRFYIVWSLVFSFLLNACSEVNEEKNAISIEWTENKAAAISIPRHLLGFIPEDSIVHLLHIHLAKTNTSILGDYILKNNEVIFSPALPFTPGLNYEVRLKNKLLSTFGIPSADTGNAPVVLSVYPTADTLPQNLLKIYIQFSKPMQEGESLKKVLLIKNNADTLSSVFLDLQPELWNNDRTILTLWLDPGRIKRDLQPNINMGPPLEQGAYYKLVIKQDWRDATGATLANVFHKEFTADVRDTLSPDPSAWEITIPKAGTNETLKIYLHEPLDHVLLTNTFRFTDNNGEVLPGEITVTSKETILNFTPSFLWKPGTYTIEIESRLEDLAGNNLNRLFDNDLTNKSKGDQKNIYRRIFRIK